MKGYNNINSDKFSNIDNEVYNCQSVYKKNDLSLQNYLQEANNMSNVNYEMQLGNTSIN